MIYLDYAATCPMLPEVIEAMRLAEQKYFANASALHTPGHLAMNEIERTRSLMAELIKAEPDEIIFTSGASEANNTVIRAFEGHEIWTSEIEHHSILETAKAYRGKEAPMLYSFMLANNETGEYLPIKKLAKEVHEKGGYMHSDLTQVLGKIPLDVKKLDLDYATFSAHKVGGPMGVGALYVKKNAPFKPLIMGGNQEHKRRGGTYNTIGLIGFGVALQKIIDEKMWEIYDTKVRTLRDELARLILAEVPGSSLNTELGVRKSLPNILNASFRAAEGESIQLYLDANDIVVSTGSACASGDIEPSHVLMAKTGDAEVAHSSIRFSLGVDNTEAEIKRTVKVLAKIIDLLQKISTIKMEVG